MSEEPGTSPLISTEEPQKDEVATKMAELETMRGDLASELEKARANNEGLSNLNETLRTLTTQRPAEPEPEPLPSDEEFETDRSGSAARVAGRVTQEALRTYHGAIAPELQELKQGLRSMELEQLRRDPDDGKDFKRLEKDMNEVLDQYQSYTSGLAKRVFFQIRGRKHNELRDMDRADAQKEPVAPIAGGGPTRRGKEPEYDSLDEVVLVHGVQKNVAAVARGLRVSQEAYFKQKHGRDMKVREAKDADR